MNVLIIQNDISTGEKQRLHILDAQHHWGTAPSSCKRAAAGIRLGPFLPFFPGRASSTKGFPQKATAFTSHSRDPGKSSWSSCHWEAIINPPRNIWRFNSMGYISETMRLEFFVLFLLLLQIPYYMMCSMVPLATPISHAQDLPLVLMLTGTTSCECKFLFCRATEAKGHQRATV